MNVFQSANGYMLIEYTESQKEQAKEIAIGRNAANAGNRARRPEYNSRASGGNLRADFLGALAEILVLELLQEYTRVSGYLPVSRTPVKSADMIVNGIRLDIKSVSKDGKFVFVNDSAHQDGRSDAYVFVLFQPGRKAELSLPVPHHRVDRWVLRDAPRPYWSCPLSALPKARTITDFLVALGAVERSE